MPNELSGEISIEYLTEVISPAENTKKWPKKREPPSVGPKAARLQRVPDPVRNLGQVIPDTAIWEALGRRDLTLEKSQTSLLCVPKKAKGSVNPILTFINYNPVGP